MMQTNEAIAQVRELRTRLNQQTDPEYTIPMQSDKTRRKITFADAILMLELHDNGWSIHAIAEAFNCSPSIVSKKLHSPNIVEIRRMKMEAVIQSYLNTWHSRYAKIGIISDNVLDDFMDKTSAKYKSASLASLTSSAATWVDKSFRMINLEMALQDFHERHLKEDETEEKQTSILEEFNIMMRRNQNMNDEISQEVESLPEPEKEMTPEMEDEIIQSFGNFKVPEMKEEIKVAKVDDSDYVKETDESGHGYDFIIKDDEDEI